MFKNLTGEKLVKSIRTGKLHELKNEIEEELVEKVTTRITEQKKQFLKNVRKSKR